MFEIYAVIAGVLLSTGAISLVHSLCNAHTSNKPFLWTLIVDSLVTILTAAFYIYCAVVLSNATVVGDDVHFTNNNPVDDDMAIINGTFYNEIEIPSFHNGTEPTPSDQTNEVEDTRSNKNKDDSGKFLENYQHLVQTNSKNRTSYRLARDMDGPAMEISSNQDCLRRVFFFQALVVCSFITCALSLLNACQFCKQCSTTNGNPRERNADNSSETFGEKILDNISSDDDSSQNAAPVGPLFEQDSLGDPVSNLDVFNVKKTMASAPQESKAKEEHVGVTAGKCTAMLTLPAICVAVVYFLIGNSAVLTPPGGATLDLWSKFNVTPSGVTSGGGNLLKTVWTDENANDTQRKEIENILQKVYAVIDKFQEDHHQEPPTVKGQYLGSRNNVTQCLDEDVKANLKMFDFLVFIVLFLTVLVYARVSETKLSGKGISTGALRKCTLAFALLWAPCMLDIVVSMVTTNRDPASISSCLVLLVGNLNRLYVSIQNAGSYKMYGKNAASIKPAFN